MISKFATRYLFFVLLFCLFTPSFSGTTPFITTWQTDVDRTIRIQVPFSAPGEFDYTVDWGDGNITNHTDVAEHIYSATGVYTISITGKFPSCNLGFGLGKLVSINQWGNNVWSSMNSMFAGCGDLESTAIDTPDLTNVQDMSRMFASTQLSNLDIKTWNVSRVVNMASMFDNTIFNQGVDISDWNVGNVTNMSGMFSQTVFNNPVDISNWDVGNVTDMSSMFFLSDFNQDIENWDVSNVTNMRNMFSHARSFNQDIGNWDVGSVTDMHSMFYFAKSFNQDIGNWNVANVENMASMLTGLETFDQDLGNWDVSSVRDMTGILALVELSIENYDSLLIGWSSKSLRNDVPFSGGPSKYCQGTEAREHIIANYNWSIIDGGPAGSITNLDNQFAITSYILPPIMGTNLTGQERYYTEPNGSGASYNIGDTIHFTDFDAYPITLYMYDSYCGTEQSFELTIESFPECSRLTFPNPTASNISIVTDINWDAVQNATGYKLFIGTTEYGRDILDITDMGDTLVYSIDSYYPESAWVYVTIVPYNEHGDAMGCTSFNFSTESIIRPTIPKFFTPNNDSRNDFWIIQNPDNELSSIFIFDRYGKLVQQVGDFAKGWDGTSQNKSVPSDDYWYLITYKNGKIVKGHFTLLR